MNVSPSAIASDREDSADRDKVVALIIGIQRAAAGLPVPLRTSQISSTSHSSTKPEAHIWSRSRRVNR